MKIDPSIKVDVICYNTDSVKKKERYRGFNIYRVPCWQILSGQFALPNYFSLIKFVIDLSRKYSYDIVHSNTRFFDHSWWAPFLSKYLKTKSALTDHCASFPVHKSRIVSLIARLIDKLTSLIFLRFYDLIMGTNKAVVEFLKGNGVKRAVLVYGGVDTIFFTPKKRKKIRSFPNINKKFSDKDVIVTFLGRMIPSKGPQLLLKSAMDLIRNYPNVYFVFAGGGRLFQKLKNKKSERIYFLGSVNKEQTAKILANSDILVHPSIHHEGFPNVILEAGASGCAVIATDAGGVRELIIHNKTGLLIRPKVENIKSGLLQLIGDWDKRLRFGIALRKKIENQFNWSNIAKDFQKILNLYD